MSPSLQASRGFTPAESNALPLPTSMKSFWQALVNAWPTLKSFASHLSTMILRPLMPPAALHHLLKASAVSKNSCSRPGAAAAPGSAVVPMRIVESVTPLAVAPLALPGPQMPFSVPKSPLPGAAAEEAAVDDPAALLVVPPVGVLEDRPQAAVSPSATDAANTTPDLITAACRDRADIFSPALECPAHAGHVTETNRWKGIDQSRVNVPADALPCASTQATRPSSAQL